MARENSKIRARIACPPGAAVSTIFDWPLRAGVVALVLAVAVLLPGCAPDDRGAGVHADRDTLRRGNGREPGTLDPARAVDIHAFGVLDDLYENLVSFSVDGRIVPGAAARWTHDANRRRFEFQLRADARWSNGDAVTADDFVRGLRRAVDPKTNAPYATMLADLQGYDAVRSGRAPATALGVHAVDPATVAFDLAGPGHTLLQVLAMPVAAPLHASMVDGNGFDDPGEFVGNGPYRLAAYRKGDRIRVEANPYHRAASDLGYCAVEYIPVQVPATELSMFRAGEIDITHTIPPAQLPTLRRRMPGAVRIAPMLGVYFLAFDTTEPPLASAPLREALSLAIDRPRLVALLGRGEQPAYGLLPPDLAADATDDDWATLGDEERRARARRLLREALDGRAPPPISLVYDAGDIHERVALAVAEMWRDVLGVETRLDKREWTYFLDTRERRGEWDAMRYAWFADYADAENFLEIFRAGSEHNLSGFADSDFDGLLAAAAETGDGALRAQHLAQAAERVRASHAIAPLYFYVSKHLVRPGIEGFVANALDRHPSRFLRPTHAPRSGGCGTAGR